MHRGRPPDVSPSNKEEILVGRSSQADVHLEDEQISRQHCKLLHTSGRWRLADCNSANGVYLDRGGRGAPFLARNDPVVSGDRLYIGRFTLSLLMDAAADAEAAESTPPPTEGADRDAKTVAVDRARIQDSVRHRLATDGEVTTPGSGRPKLGGA
ncbi:MAG: FHA domain-containing protein [Myxococcota bacterium]